MLDVPTVLRVGDDVKGGSLRHPSMGRVGGMGPWWMVRDFAESTFFVRDFADTPLCELFGIVVSSFAEPYAFIVVTFVSMHGLGTMGGQHRRNHSLLHLPGEPTC